MEGLAFVKVTQHEVEVLRELSTVTFIDTYAAYNTEEDMLNYIETEFSSAKLMSGLNSVDSAFYFALDGLTPTGYIKVNYAGAQTDINDSKCLELERIYVLKKYQGKKIGQFLLDGALAIAKHENLDYVWLGVWDKNINAQKFYAKNGFTAFGSHTFQLGEDEQQDILLKKELA